MGISATGSHNIKQEVSLNLNDASLSLVIIIAGTKKSYQYFEMSPFTKGLKFSFAAAAVSAVTLERSRRAAAAAAPKIPERSAALAEVVRTPLLEESFRRGLAQFRSRSLHQTSPALK